jgi:hypothetical protein
VKALRLGLFTFPNILYKMFPNSYLPIFNNPRGIIKDRDYENPHYDPVIVFIHLLYPPPP